MPLWFHADETQYVQHGEEKAYALSFCSLACGKRYLLAAIPVHLMVDEDRVNRTLWALLAWLRYELECLHAGRCPTHDWKGNAFHDRRANLAGTLLPVRARALGMKGDQKFLHEARNCRGTCPCHPLNKLGQRQCGAGGSQNPRSAPKPEPTGPSQTACHPRQCQ